MLDKALDEQDFKEIFFAILETASTSCGDRVSLYMNSLHFQYLLSEQSCPSDLEAARLIIGLNRVDLLEKEAQIFVQDYRGVIDEIEVHLALLVKLQQSLDLPLFKGVDGMVYFRFSGLTEERINEIGSRVKDQTQDNLELLVGSDMWQKYLKKTYNKEYLSILNEYLLSDPTNKESDQDYQERIASITNNKERALTDFYKEKAREVLPLLDI